LYPAARFILIGPFDPDPAAITLHELSRSVQDGMIEFVGPVKDVRPIIAIAPFMFYSHTGKALVPSRFVFDFRHDEVNASVARSMI
jgi:hypothetical protein